jgi:hypothetical protein
VECATVSTASACWPNKGEALGRGAVHVFKLRRMLELRAVHRLWRRPAPVIASARRKLTEVPAEGGAYERRHQLVRD